MIDWAKFQVHWDWVGHMVEATIQAIIIAAFITLTFGTHYSIAMLFGGAAAVGHFWGREKRDYENEVKMPPPQLKSYFFWRWSYDGKTDFFPSVALYAVYVIVFLFLHPDLVTFFPVFR